MKNLENGEKERVGKLLLQTSVRELHNNLIDTVANGGLACARNAEGKVVISDMALHYLLPSQLKQMTLSHKQTCGCEICLSVASMHQSLCAFHVCYMNKKKHEIEEMHEGHH